MKHKLFLLFIICFCGVLYSQKYSFITPQGYNNTYIFKILPDKHGYLWILHAGGISRFDGVNSVNYDHRNGLNTTNNYDLDFYNNSLVVSTDEYGLSFGNGNTFQTYNKQRGFASDVVFSTKIIDDELWSATYDHGLIHWKKSLQPEVILYKNEEMSPAFALDSDDKGNIWYGGANGLFKYNSQTKEHIQVLGDSCYISNIFCANKKIYVLSIRGFFTIHENGQIVQDKKIIFSDIFYRIHVGKSGRIYVGTYNGLIIIENNSYEYITVDNGLPSHKITDIYEDDNEMIWLGTDNGLCCIANRPSIKKYSTPEISSTIYSIFHDKDSNLVMGTGANSVYKFKSNTFSKYGEEIGFGYLYAFYHDVEKDEFYTSFEKNLYTLKNGKITTTQLQTDLDDIPSKIDKIGNKLVFLANDAVYVNTRDNIFEKIEQTENKSLSISFSDGNKLWMLGLKGDVMVMNPDLSLEDYTSIINPERHSLLNGMYVDGLDIYLFAGFKGLFAWNKYQSYDLTGLVDGTVSAIIKDTKGNIWVSGKELYVYNSDKKDITKYNVKDGISTLNDRSLHEFNGKIYLGSNRDLVEIDHQRHLVLSNQTFHNKLIVEKIYYKDDVYFDLNLNTENISVINLEHHQNNLNLTLQPFNYYNKNLTYQYILEGFEESNNNSSSGEITYTNLPPGDYTLKAQTLKDGKISSNELQLKIFIDKPYWQKFWFYAIEISIVLFVLFLTYFLNRNTYGKVTQVMTIFSIIMIFEILVFYLSQKIDKFTNGIPVFQIIMNILLALVLLPLEQYIKNKLTALRKK